MQSLPARHRFTKDVKNVPWTGGKGDQTIYDQAVSHWYSFQNNLSDDNRDRIDSKNRGFALLAHLFGHAAEIFCTNTSDIVAAEDGTQLIVETIHEQNKLSVVSNICNTPQSLIRTVRRNGVSFRLFEGRFNERLHCFNAVGTKTKISEAISVIFLHNNANVEKSQRISFLAAATPYSATHSPSSLTEELVDAVWNRSCFRHSSLQCTYK